MARALTRSLIGLKQSSNDNQPIRIRKYQNICRWKAVQAVTGAKSTVDAPLASCLTTVNTNNEYPPNNNSFLLLTKTIKHF